MYKLVLDLENKIKVFICDDDTLLEIRDLPYSGDVLGEIMEMVQGYPIEESTIVVHSVFSKCIYKDACVVTEIGADDNRFIGSVPLNDLNKLITVFNGCKTRIIDITQYLFSYKLGNCCYVDRINGTCRVYISDSTNTCVDHFMCSEESLEERLELAKQKYGVENTYNCYELGDVIDIMYFSNAALLCESSSDVISDAALAAYAFEISDAECLDFSIIEQSTENIQNVDNLSVDDKVICETSGDIANEVHDVVDSQESTEVEQTSHSDAFFSVGSETGVENDEEENLTVPKNSPRKKIQHKTKRSEKKLEKKPKKSLEKKSKFKKKDDVSIDSNCIPPKTENKPLGNVVLLVGVVGMIIAGVIFGVNTKYKNDLVALNSDKTAVQTQLTESQGKIDTYNACLSLEGNDLFKSVDLVSQEMASCGGHLTSLKFNDNTSKATIQFNTPEDAGKFIEQVTQTYPDVVVGEPMDGNIVEISLN